MESIYDILVWNNTVSNLFHKPFLKLIFNNFHMLMVKLWFKNFCFLPPQNCKFLMSLRRHLPYKSKGLRVFTYRYGGIITIESETDGLFAFKVLL
jgi:hypothetical protein